MLPRRLLPLLAFSCVVTGVCAFPVSGTGDPRRDPFLTGSQQQTFRSFDPAVYGQSLQAGLASLSVPGGHVEVRAGTWYTLQSKHLRLVGVGRFELEFGPKGAQAVAFNLDGLDHPLRVELYDAESVLVEAYSFEPSGADAASRYIGARSPHAPYARAVFRVPVNDEVIALDNLTVLPGERVERLDRVRALAEAYGSLPGAGSDLEWARVPDAGVGLGGTLGVLSVLALAARRRRKRG